MLLPDYSSQGRSFWKERAPNPGRETGELNGARAEHQDAEGVKAKDLSLLPLLQISPLRPKEARLGPILGHTSNLIGYPGRKELSG